MTNYQYVIGDNPYDNAQEWRQRGNGKWSCEAPTLQKALERIFGSMLYPAELVGRLEFVPGISLEEMSDNEVIQVWSNDPEVAAKTHKHKRLRERWPHLGDGKSTGLACEVSIYQLDQYLTPPRLMLAQGAAPEGNASPVGVAVAEFHRGRIGMLQSIQDKKWDLSVAKWDLNQRQDEMREQVVKMNQQIFLADTYLRGTDNIRQLSEGVKGSGPYHIFQQRQFLDKEIALIANLQDFDCQQLHLLEAWIIKNKAWKKMLPFERCILVTRIRQEEKDYGCPWLNAFLNDENLMSIVWIRDGENVYRIVSEVKFDNAVLTDPGEEARVTAIVNEAVFNELYLVKHENWRGDPVVPEKEGTISKKAVNATDDVYIPISKMPRRFKKIEDWLASDDYTTKIQIEIAKKVSDYMAKVNKKRLVFAIFLQGIVDNTTLLDIPKGTSVFDWNVACNFFHLHTEYSHGLPDGQARDEWRAFSDPLFVHAGETLLMKQGWIDTTAEKRTAFGGNRLKFFNVRRMVNGRPEVAYYPLGKRWPHDPLTIPRNGVLLDKARFIKASMPASLAARLLEDRDWKENNRDWVPVLAQWSAVQAQWKTCKNADNCKLKECED
jgi:hypothetical protein